MKQILKWAGLGVVGGYVVMSLATTTMMVGMIYMQTQQFPPDLLDYMLVGGAIGAAFGAYLAGVTEGRTEGRR
ncbi:MAG: hypothetical protein ACXAEN_27270 [Candidatus Thorarchaeota archaeon]|jgi:uncharacterized membrane protein YfcA